MWQLTYTEVSDNFLMSCVFSDGPAFRHRLIPSFYPLIAHPSSLYWELSETHNLRKSEFSQIRKKTKKKKLEKLRQFEFQKISTLHQKSFPNQNVFKFWKGNYKQLGKSGNGFPENWIFTIAKSENPWANFLIIKTNSDFWEIF